MRRAAAKLVIFDCDGTIVDSQHAIVAAMERAFADHGRPAPSRAAVLAVVGLSLSEAIVRLVPSSDPADIAALADSYKGAFAALRREAVHREPLFPGAEETLRALAARDDICLGIATGKSRRGVDALLEREGFTGLFATIQTADDNPSKPHPSMIERAIAETAAEPARTVMIGDTTFDIEMARRAGVTAVGVEWGYHSSAALIAAGAHVLVSEFAGLVESVDRLLPEPEAAA
ncbi:MAG: HAD-IA family hydrolase [Hyphomicrobiaceae bacterium]|nr:HAD-IA family hydrolase [Hyphomicrobiaceae bacterium]